MVLIVAAALTLMWRIKDTDCCYITSDDKLQRLVV